jgi:hypothetical protein
MVIDQSRHGVTKDPQAARPQPGPPETASIHPAVHRPSAYVQYPSCLINPQKSLLLQCENRIHDASLRTLSECFCDQSGAKKRQKRQYPYRLSSPVPEAAGITPKMASFKLPEPDTNLAKLPGSERIGHSRRTQYKLYPLERTERRASGKEEQKLHVVNPFG